MSNQQLTEQTSAFIKVVAEHRTAARGRHAEQLGK